MFLRIHACMRQTSAYHYLSIYIYIYANIYGPHCRFLEYGIARQLDPFAHMVIFFMTIYVYVITSINIQLCSSFTTCDNCYPLHTPCRGIELRIRCLCFTVLNNVCGDGHLVVFIALHSRFGFSDNSYPNIPLVNADKSCSLIIQNIQTFDIYIGEVGKRHLNAPVSIYI